MATAHVFVRYNRIVPAVHHNGLVASPPLDFGHLLNHISHSLQVRAATIRSPVGDVELAQLISTVGLQRKKYSVMVNLSAFNLAVF